MPFVEKRGSAPLTLGYVGSPSTEMRVEEGRLNWSTYQLSAVSMSSVNAVQLSVFARSTIASLSGGSSLAEVFPLTDATTVPGSTAEITLAGRGKTFAGVLRDAADSKLALVKSGSQDQTLAGINTYTGATTISLGRLILGGSGTALNSPVTVGRNGTLALDNSVQAVSDRISSSLPISVAGKIILQGNPAQAVQEVFGTLQPTGNPTIEVIPHPNQPAALSFRDLDLSTSTAGSPIFLGTKLGAPSGPGVAAIRFVNAPILLGGGGAAGSTAASIIPGVFGGESSVQSFLTYGPDGVRPLNDAEYETNLHAALLGTNVHLAAAFSLSASLAINSLRLGEGVQVHGAGTLQVVSGSLLCLGASANLRQAALEFGSGRGSIYTAGTLEISGSVIARHGLQKTGPGTLILSGSNDLQGTSAVNQGVLRVAHSGALGSGGGTIALAPGTSVQLDSGVSVPAVPLSFADSGGTLRSLGGLTSWGGSISGVGSIRVDSGTLTLGAPFSGTIQKTGSGVLSIASSPAPSSYLVITEGSAQYCGPGLSATGSARLASSLRVIDATLHIAPAGAGTNAVLQVDGGSVALTYGSDATVVLDRALHNSIEVQIPSLSALSSFSRIEGGTLVLRTVGGDLGEEIQLKVGGSSTIPTVAPRSVVLQSADGLKTGSFLRYNSVKGYVPATSTAPAGAALQTAGSSALFVARSPQKLTSSATVSALVNEGQIIDLGASQLTLTEESSSSGEFAGLIMNGGEIRGGTLALAHGAVIYTSLAGATISSALTNHVYRNSREHFTFFGPGKLTLSGESNYSTATLVNGSTLQLDGKLRSSIKLSSSAKLTGTGSTSGGVQGGLVSPGVGIGTLTVASVEGGGSAQTAFAFELGAYGGSFPLQQTSDLLRLTGLNPLPLSLTLDNTVSLYFASLQELKPGAIFRGGFYFDDGTFFDRSIPSAHFRYFFGDDTGSVIFEGKSYSEAIGTEFQVSMVQQSSLFGLAQARSSVMQVQVVPEPSGAALFASALLFGASRRWRRS